MTSRIAIIGGGPAGSAVTLNLLREGIDPRDITIFDRAEFPRPKLCGGALTYRGTQALADLIGKPSDGGQTTRLEFRSKLGCYDVREPGPQWLYDRAYLDHRLLDRCVEWGVEVRQKSMVTELAPTGDQWAVVANSVRERFDWVIGADGANGISRRASRLPGGHTGRLVEGVFESDGSEADPSCLYFDFDPVFDGISGYAWLFPYPKPGSRGLWKVGIMDGRGNAPGAALRAWTQKYAERNGFRMVDRKIAGWPEHYYHPHARGHRSGLVLVGEAFGIDPLLGEGIAPALEMANYAACRIRQALDQGLRDLPNYEAGFRRTVEGRNLWFQAKLANRIYGRHPERWMRVMFGVPYLHRLAGSGEQAYGRLRHNAGKMIAALAWHVVSMRQVS